MNVLGVQLTLLLGPTVPLPAPQPVIEALESVEVTHNDQGRSGFQLVFRVGRDELLGLIDYPLLLGQTLRPFNRVVLFVIFEGIPQVVMDGIITQHSLNPGQRQDDGTLTVIGEDVSVMMDLEEKSVEHPAQDETIIATKIIATYAMYGLIPEVMPPVVIDPPLPIERTPVQQGTDRAYLEQMATRHGYVFAIIPGPVPGVNTAYWGPPKRIGLPQPALSVNMGPSSNVDQIDFRYDALATTMVEGSVQDRLLGTTLPVFTVVSTRPPLVSMPAWLVDQPDVRVEQFRDSGLTITQAMGRAQGRTDASTDRVVTATGELDALRYGGLLQARGLVGVRGAGYSYDGNYYVSSVTHTMRRDEYRQRFTLTREGVGSLTPVVRP